ncbi:MAG: hypothetical protein KC486_13875, partial [Myxococcales bacterium]|nr:hypothetical protein [Myxococcales bacterium]
TVASPAVADSEAAAPTAATTETEAPEGAAPAAETSVDDDAPQTPTSARKTESLAPADADADEKESSDD